MGEGKPIPVVQFATAPGVRLDYHKLALITSLTREVVESSNAEAIVRAVLAESAALGLDAALLSANAATPDAPAGLLNGITPMTPSTATPLTERPEAYRCHADGACGGATSRDRGVP